MRDCFPAFYSTCETFRGRLQESLSQIACDLQAAFTVSKVLHAYAGWQIGLQMHLIMMAHTQDSFQKVQTHTALYGDLHHSLKSDPKIKPSQSPAAAQLCFLKFCLSTVRSHSIADLISRASSGFVVSSGLQLSKQQIICTDLCSCLDPSNSPSVLQPIFPPSWFLKTTWAALRMKVGRLQKRSPGHLGCPSKWLQPFASCGKVGVHPFCCQCHRYLGSQFRELSSLSASAAVPMAALAAACTASLPGRAQAAPRAVRMRFDQQRLPAGVLCTLVVAGLQIAWSNMSVVLYLKVWAPN